MPNLLKIALLAAAALLVLLAAVAWIPLREHSPAVPNDLVFVIEPGTATAAMQGEDVSALPEKIQLVAGQAISIRNEDYAMHYFFSVPIAPGQTVRKQFDKPGRFGYSTVMSCSIGRITSLSIEVSPASAT